MTFNGTTQPRFAIYRHIDAGVICLAMDERSTILYCNRKMAAMLGCRPSDLIDKSLDQIAVNNRPHSSYTKGLRSEVQTITRKTRGGLTVKAYMQGGPKQGQTIALNVSSVEKVTNNGNLYLLGYVRPATRIERWIEKSGYNWQYRRFMKPLLLFFLGGTWRPQATAIATMTAPIWLPLVIEKFPAIAQVLQSLLGI